MFQKYHTCISEISDTVELIEEAADDAELREMLKADLENLLGNEEEYGTIEEIQEDIVTTILPESEADK